MNLIQTLILNKDKTPDQIVALISDPLRMFIKCHDVTEQLLDRVNFRTREIAYFKFQNAHTYDGLDMCWNGGRSAENVRRTLGSRTRLANFHTSELRSWAFIGYEHRLEVDPFKIDWQNHDYCGFS